MNVRSYSDNHRAFALDDAVRAPSEEDVRREFQERADAIDGLLVRVEAIRKSLQDG